ncbi:hypothetical protein DRH13_03320, partial [Candidatus Woesebacteria bacterium]
MDMEASEKKRRKGLIIFGTFAVAVLIAAPVLFALGNWQWSIVAALLGISFILLTIGLFIEISDKGDWCLSIG